MELKIEDLESATRSGDIEWEKAEYSQEGAKALYLCRMYGEEVPPVLISLFIYTKSVAIIIEGLFGKHQVYHYPYKERPELCSLVEEGIREKDKERHSKNVKWLREKMVDVEKANT